MGNVVRYCAGALDAELSAPLKGQVQGAIRARGFQAIFDRNYLGC